MGRGLKFTATAQLYRVVGKNKWLCRTIQSCGSGGKLKIVNEQAGNNIKSVKNASIGNTFITFAKEKT